MERDEIEKQQRQDRMRQPYSDYDGSHLHRRWYGRLEFWACIWSFFCFNLSFLWAFWWPPSACEFANSLKQYWQWNVLPLLLLIGLSPRFPHRRVIGESFASAGTLMSSIPNSLGGFLWEEDEEEEEEIGETKSNENGLSILGISLSLFEQL
ncbi:unnamed protein product [Citrullus colocynthis]|uniref:Uncharacterized protein n=1 Tax=Citrullus colocynthis TaxID=252529 RepID=A0ABP0XK84_9ROSI